MELPASIAANIGQFTGRSWLLPKVLDWYDHSNGRLFLVTGKPGTGKSMVAAWLAGNGPLPKDDREHCEMLGRLRGLVKGVHFCRANAPTNNPRGFADGLLHQLTRQVKGFDQALLKQMGSSRVITINVKQNVDRAEGPVNVTGVEIQNLELGQRFDESSFDLAVIKPLESLYANGFDEPILLLVDALDEALTFVSPFKIIQAILNIIELQAPVRVLATLRDDPDTLQYFRNMVRVDLLDDAPPDEDDVRTYVEGRLAGRDNGQLRQLVDKVVTNAGGNFLFAYLVTEDLLPSLEKGQSFSLADVPTKLGDYYHRSLLRLKDREGHSWSKELRPLLGLVAVSQGTGLTRSQLAQITHRSPTETLDTLRACKPYLDGKLNDGPFRPFHKSFEDYLIREKENLDFPIDGAEANADVTYHYWPPQEGYPPWVRWDIYTKRWMPTHLAEASRTESPEARHNMATRLVTLMADQAYVQDRKIQADDLGQLERDLLQTLETGCRDPMEAALPLVVRAVRGLYAFRRFLLQPRDIFRHASQMQFTTAIQHLDLFPLEERWRAAAELLIAWIAVEKDDPIAEEILQHVKDNYRMIWPLTVLEARVRAAQENSEANLLPLPEAPELDMLNAILYRLASEKTETGMVDEYLHMVSEYLDSAAYVGEPMGEAYGTDSGPRYLAEVDGPVLVAYVADTMKGTAGNRAFVRYLQMHAANLYIQYRNLNLWALMDAVLRHPDPSWTRLALVHLLSIALSTQGAGYNEGLPLALLGLKAAAKDPAARQELDQRLALARQRAGQLSELKGKGDMWGEHRRRYCALALAFSLLDGKQTPQKLLNEAASLPRGFAGFMVGTFLHLVETMHALQVQPALIPQLLDQALTSAHRIQDPIFCARSTAQVNALQRRWWPFPDEKDLAETIERFANNPQLEEFCPVHLVGEGFDQREYTRTKMQMPDNLFNARTPEQIAEALGISQERLRDLNDWKGIGPDTELPPGTEVNLPDPSFIPLLAARLSAEVMARPLSIPEQQLLIQRLVPLAITDLSALDAVLSRLLVVTRVKSDRILSAIDPSPIGGRAMGGQYDELLAEL